MGNADLNNVSGGSWDWFDRQLRAIDATRDVVFLVTHQPFRCRAGVPDWYFCFSKRMKQAFRTAVIDQGLERAFERGAQLSGHQHRWFDGTAFDEWPSFRQFEVSAVKGDVFDGNMSSSFAIFDVGVDGKTTSTRKFWREAGVWRQAGPHAISK